MGITKLDIFAINLYNKVGRDISIRDANYLLSKIEKVENDPGKLMKLYDNKVIYEALTNKYLNTYNRYNKTCEEYLETPKGKLENRLAGFFNKKNGVPGEKNIKSENSNELRRIGIMLDNARVDSSSKGSTSGGNESVCKVIANKIYTINKGNPLGDRIKIELDSRNKQLNGQSTPDLVTMRSKEPSKITHFFRKIICGNSAHLVEKIEEKERIDIIMKFAKDYTEHMEPLISEDTGRLINKYDKLKAGETKKPDLKPSDGLNQ